MDLSSLEESLKPENQKKAQANEKEGTKSFTFRNLDPNLHTTWKTCASMRGTSMEEFGIKAIKEYIKVMLTPSKKPEGA